MKKTWITTAVVLILLVLGLVWGFAFPRVTADEVTFTVVDKERVVTGSGASVSSKYLIFTDREVYENTDSIFVWKFNSSDVYGELQEGETYKAKVYGWRIEWMSWYRNIVDVQRAR